jgi:hypothetical protein
MQHARVKKYKILVKNNIVTPLGALGVLLRDNIKMDIKVIGRESVD